MSGGWAVTRSSFLGDFGKGDAVRLYNGYGNCLGPERAERAMVHH